MKIETPSLMLVSAIVAISRNRVIGKDNQIPWRLPADLKYFKRRTLNHHIIMGRKSFESIGRPLPKRSNIVLTRDPFFAASGCIVVHTLEEALTLAQDKGDDEAFIIGGGAVYEQSMPLWDRLYLTEVAVEVEGDVFFPQLPPEEWKLVSEDHHRADEKNPHDYTFKVFERQDEA